MKKLFSCLVLSSFLLVACGGGGGDEKQNFIDATVEVTCMVFEAEDLLDPSLEQNTKDIFENYGFDVENEAEMEEVTKRYENDPDVQTAVEAALAECAGDLLEAFGAMGDLDMEDVDMEEVGDEE
jgi:hypothetical protein